MLSLNHDDVCCDRCGKALFDDDGHRTPEQMVVFCDIDCATAFHQRMKAAPKAEIRLTQALMRLGLSWAQGYRAILTGRLTGRQEANGRWVVTVESVDAYVACR